MLGLTVDVGLLFKASYIMMSKVDRRIDLTMISKPVFSIKLSKLERKTIEMNRYKAKMEAHYMVKGFARYQVLRTIRRHEKLCISQCESKMMFALADCNNIVIMDEPEK